jgi:hypothetical protein
MADEPEEPEMSEPIIEQIAVLLAARLATITIVNGYDFDIGEVCRPPSLTNPDLVNLQSILYQGEESPAESQAYGHDTRMQEFIVALILRPAETDTTAADTHMNRFASAIRKHLHSDQTWAAKATDFSVFGPEPLPPESNLEGAQMRVVVTYRTLENDPYTQ